MKTAAERAKEVAQDPEIKAWIRRFKKLAAEMPKSIWVYVASGTPHVMAFSEESQDTGTQIYENPDGGMTQEAVIASVRGGSWDGGDW